MKTPPSADNETVLTNEQAADASVGTFLKFRLGSDEYAIDVMKAREVRHFETPMPIAGAPAYLLGVLDQRGMAMPVVDLRLRCGTADVGYDSDTAMIVLDIRGGPIGMVVDRVTEVVRLKVEQLRAVRDCSSAVSAEHLMAIANTLPSDRALMLVDIDQLLMRMMADAFGSLAVTKPPRGKVAASRPSHRRGCRCCRQPRRPNPQGSESSPS